VLPLLSSRQVAAALERAGFHASRPAKGSHQAYEKSGPDRTLIVILPLAKKEIPRGTLRSILRQADLLEEEFLRFLR
jgi:predicted RNA binding protein YcfA (HicA-like mRNA interferase family)